MKSRSVNSVFGKRLAQLRKAKEWELNNLYIWSVGFLFTFKARKRRIASLCNVLRNEEGGQKDKFKTYEF